MEKKREIWVDNVKVIACILVVIGPMIVAIIMRKSKWLEFFLYPGKFIKR